MIVQIMNSSPSGDKKARLWRVFAFLVLFLQKSCMARRANLRRVIAEPAFFADSCRVVGPENLDDLRHTATIWQKTGLRHVHFDKKEYFQSARKPSQCGAFRVLHGRREIKKKDGQSGAVFFFEALIQDRFLVPSYPSKG